MVEIECHVCKKEFSIHKSIDTDNYDGEVVCPECKSMLHVKIVKGKLQKRKVIKRQPSKSHLGDEYAKAALAYAKQERDKLIEEFGEEKK